jgi:hypothetical protein
LQQTTSWLCCLITLAVPVAVIVVIVLATRSKKGGEFKERLYRCPATVTNIRDPLTGINGQTADSMQVSFLLSNGVTYEFWVPRRDYSWLKAGHQGVLTFYQERFESFIP